MADPRNDPSGDHPEEQPPDQAEIDRQWEGIVAGFGPLEMPGPPREELSEHRPEEDPDSGRPPASGLSRHFTDPPSWGPRDYAVDDEDDGAFVPPDPPALGSGRPAVVLSAAGLAGAPLALLLAALFWPGIPGILVTILITVMVAGGVGLFLALPRDKDRGGPWNGDGAQV